MKLVLFAHKPPPVHGQSLMVQLMLNAFGGDCRRKTAQAGPHQLNTNPYGIEVYHVNARLSHDLPDVGRPRLAKIPRLIFYCAQAIWIRFRYGVTAMYYVPAPPRRAAIYRDWIVMLLCRPFFKTLVFHWHAVGLGAWLTQQATAIERWLTHLLLGRATTAIVLSRFNQPDAEVLRPHRTFVVTNGIPDPCPDYVPSLAAKRAHRASHLQRLFQTQTPATNSTQPHETVHVLFLAHCTRDKGFFDAIEGVKLANARLAADKTPISFRLTMVGSFLRADEQAEFEKLLGDLGDASWLRHLGFISEPEKWALYREADVFCFPTYFAFEGQPMNLIEAMAFGLPIVTTRWRSIPEHIPSNYPGLIEPRHPDQIATALLAVTTIDGTKFRQVFETQFSVARHLKDLADAIKSTSQ